MKAQDLYAGYEYAWYPERPKGLETPLGAAKVKLIRIVRRKADPYNERLSTFALVELLEDYKRNSYYKQGTSHEVRARDIVDFWEDYHDREEAILEERRQKERERQEALAHLQMQNDRIVSEFEKIGLPARVSHTGHVTILRMDALRWMRERIKQEELLR